MTLKIATDLVFDVMGASSPVILDYYTTAEHILDVNNYLPAAGKEERQEVKLLLGNVDIAADEATLA